MLLAVMGSKYPELCTEASPIASAFSIGDRLLTVHLCRLEQTPEADLVAVGARQSVVGLGVMY